MRIFVVVSGQQWLGGITIQTALLCRELERQGHTVVVASIGAPAVVDQFRHQAVHYGDDVGQYVPTPPPAGTDAVVDPNYVFRYEVIADAARYLPPGPPAVRRALAPAVRLGMAAIAPPPSKHRAPLADARGAAASLLRGVTAALDAGLSGGAAEAPFLARLLLHTEQRDLDRLEQIRRWFKPDVEYACDLALVPMMARLEDLGIPLVAAAQGFEIVYRRGVGLLDALRAARQRLDLILSGSKANIDDNVADLREIAGEGVPARAIPYGVELDGGWDMPREQAVQRLIDLQRHLSPGQMGPGGLWGRERGSAFVITCFSRIDVEKGTDLPLHALAILRSQGVPARLWIAGNTMPGSAFLDVVRSKIRLMDLEPHVSLIGTLNDRRDKVALLRASDAFVAGFIRSEPFGLVYTEAFAAGLPVVAPASGAAPELFKVVGETGTLYVPNDTGAMAASLGRVYGDGELRHRLATEEQRAFRERFNATEMARAAATAFAAAIETRQGRRHDSHSVL